MRELPEGWETIKLEQAGSWAGGGTPSKSNPIFWVDGTIPWVSPKDMKVIEISTTEDYITEEAVSLSSAKKISKNSILIVTRSGILGRTLPVAINMVEVALNQDMKAISTTVLEPRYLLNAFRRYEREILEECSKAGTTVESIESDKLKKFEIPLPPLNEQKRIADRLDLLLTSIDKAKAHLDRIPPLLKRFRQSVLAAATSGKLTEDWREEHPSLESSQIVNIICQSHTDAGGHKRGNAAMPTEGVHDLTQSMFPDTWNILELRDIVNPEKPITYGILKPGPELEIGIPYIRVADFPGNKLSLSNIRKTSKEIDSDFSRSKLSEGDIVLSIRGTVGRTVVVPNELSGANITQDSARL